MKYIQWIDVINKYHKKFFNEEGWMNVKNREYGEALRICHKFCRKHPGYGKTNLVGKQIFIKDQFDNKFYKFFIKRFTFVKLKMSRRRMREKFRRQQGVRIGDRRLTDKLYEEHGIDLDKLSVKEYKEFVECKDVIHERIYGNIERFFKLNHGYINNSIEKEEKFMNQLYIIYNQLIDERNGARLQNGKRFERYVIPDK